VYNPATGEVIDQVPLSGAADVDAAVQAAVHTYQSWSRTAVMERVRLMFRFKQELEEHFEELAAIVTRHHGKTLDESRGEVRRGIEVVDFACGAPTLLQGRTLRDVSGGVDQDLYRFPVGVCAGIPPFNFPVMIPLWMFPLAVVAGNTFVLKPSARTRRSMRCSSTPTCAPSPSSAPSRWRATSTGRPPRTASACRLWAAPRTTSSSCRTRTSTSRCRPSRTRPSATPARGVSRVRWRWSSAARPARSWTR